ncbi:MAG TPA: protein kinase [Terriglobales bacterium]|nr:protein kinase [Terriglobales bacterium]
MPASVPCRMIGHVLGHYRIIEKIGEGGMGEVYRARDDRLSRDVAVKIIRPSASADPDRLRRFEQEAQAAAALNHPNIVAIYDVGIHEGSPYIVSELLEGHTLRERLFEGPLPVRQTVDYALQIAQGLVAAHEKNIVHRDLKPENIFVTKDGRVKILDFGIAKLTPRPRGPSDAISDMVTQTKSGVVLGTAAYMSPEQLRAKNIDFRTDIFSFGTIFYEMLSGMRAFRGETDVDTITAVLREDPVDLSELRPAVPVAFEPIVAHCLEKDPDNRFQSSRDLVFALKTLSHVSTGKVTSVRLRHIPTWLAWAAGALVFSAITAWVASRTASAPKQVSYQRLTFQRGTVYSARFAPADTSVIYDAAWNGNPEHLYSTSTDSPIERALDFHDAHLLALSPTGELALSLHGNHGSRLEFINGTLARAPLSGGAPRELIEDVRFADWDKNGQLAVARRVDGKSRLEYPVGKVLYQTAGWIGEIRISPDGSRVAFLDHPALWDDRGAVLIVDTDGHTKTLSSGWESEDGIAWNPTGREVWFTAVQRGYDRRLWAVSLSGKLRELLAVPGGMILDDIALDGRVLITFMSERLSMEARKGGKDQDLSWYDWTIAKDISPDGRSVLFEEASEPTGANYWIALRALDGSPPIRLGEGSAGGLAPDGKSALAVFTGYPQHISILPVGVGEARTIVPAGVENVLNGPIFFLPDGKHIAFSGNQSGHLLRSYTIALDGSDLRPITPEGSTAYVISPDGQYTAALDANESTQIYPLAGGAPRPIPGLVAAEIPVQWSQDGSSLYVFRKGEVPLNVYRVNIRNGTRDLVRELAPPDKSGVVGVGPIAMTRDASSFVFSYYRVISTLYVISGLH